MQDAPLLVSGILRRGSEYHGDSKVFTISGPDADFELATFSDVGARAAQLAHALGRLGIEEGDRVATLCWNHQSHLEAYLAVPSMGAVLHTLNLRLFPEQLAYVINHAADKVIIVDASLVPLLESVWAQLTTVRHVIVVGEFDGNAFRGALAYEDVLGGEASTYDWPTFDERRAAAMCYTSGTTGDPKGVVYTHRSTVLHAMNVTSATTFGLTERSRVLLLVPMFHAGAWGAPYGAFMVGADIVLPRQFVQAAPLAAIVAKTRPTWSAGVPTIWNDLLQYADSNPVDLSSLASVCSGGAAASRGLIQRFEERFDVEMVQGWGMTETSPLCALAHPPNDAEGDLLDWKVKTGRVLPGVEVRIVDEAGDELAKDGVVVGEFEVRGPWIASSYYGVDASDRFHDGWLRTGDVGSLDRRGFMAISDRSKDVIKTGGEWISSVELENAVMDHPAVFEAAAIGVPDVKWSERPLVAVVRATDSEVTADELRAFLGDKVPRWWLPERWVFLETIPRTSVGKFDKKALRTLYEDGALSVVEVVTASEGQPA
jgi:fatty-acyl-CoA synthase